MPDDRNSVDAHGVKKIERVSRQRYAPAIPRCGRRTESRATRAAQCRRDRLPAGAMQPLCDLPPAARCVWPSMQQHHRTSVSRPVHLNLDLKQLGPDHPHGRLLAQPKQAPYPKVKGGHPMCSQVGCGFISPRDRAARHSRVSRVFGQWGDCQIPGAVEWPACTGVRRPFNKLRRARGPAGVANSAAERLGQHALDRQQLALDLEPAGVTAESATGMQDAVAGHDDW